MTDSVKSDNASDTLGGDLAPPEPRQSPGEILRKAREQAGMSLGDVQQATHLQIRNMEFLEADCFEKLPGETFIRGYIRTYAKFLKLDAGAVIAAYEAYLRDIQGTTAEILKPEPRVKRLNLQPQTMMLGALWTLVVGFGLYLVIGTLGSDSPSETEAPAVEMSAPEAAPLAAPAEESSPTPLDDEAAPGEPFPAGSEDETQEPDALGAGEQPLAESDIAAQSDAEPVSPASEAELVLSFSGDSWVKITDGNGEVLVSALKKADDRISLQGSPPYRLLIGDANTTTVLFRGEPVPLIPRSGSNSVRLRLGSGE